MKNEDGKDGEQSENAIVRESLEIFIVNKFRFESRGTFFFGAKLSAEKVKRSTSRSGERGFRKLLDTGLPGVDEVDLVSALGCSGPVSVRPARC